MYLSGFADIYGQGDKPLNAWYGFEMGENLIDRLSLIGFDEIGPFHNHVGCARTWQDSCTTRGLAGSMPHRTPTPRVLSRPPYYCCDLVLPTQNISLNSTNNVNFKYLIRFILQTHCTISNNKRDYLHWYYKRRYDVRPECWKYKSSYWAWL